MPVRIADGGIPLRDAGGFPVAVLPQWSADSRWIYYRALFDGEVQVWRAARGGSRSEQITHGPANVKDFPPMGTSTPDRKSVVEGMRVSARVEPGGHRTLKKKKKTK